MLYCESCITLFTSRPQPTENKKSSQERDRGVMLITYGIMIIRRSVGAPVDENKQVSVCIPMHAYHTDIQIQKKKNKTRRISIMVLVMISNPYHHRKSKQKRYPQKPTQLMIDDETDSRRRPRRVNQLRRKSIQSLATNVRCYDSGAQGT